MLKNYELLYILHPDLEGSSEKVTDKVSGFITKAGGEVTNQEDWGKRKLAYKIAKNDFGVYVLVNFTLPSGKLPEVERELRLSEEVIRFMIVTLPEVREPKKEKKAAKKSAEPVKEEVKEAKQEEKKEEPKEEKPKAKRETAKKEVKEEVKAEEKPKKTAKKEDKKEEKENEAERMKKLDEKLEEILGE